MRSTLSSTSVYACIFGCFLRVRVALQGRSRVLSQASHYLPFVLRAISTPFRQHTA